MAEANQASTNIFAGNKNVGTFPQSTSITTNNQGQYNVCNRVFD